MHLDANGKYVQRSSLVEKYNQIIGNLDICRVATKCGDSHCRQVQVHPKSCWEPWLTKCNGMTVIFSTNQTGKQCQVLPSLVLCTTLSMSNVGSMVPARLVAFHEGVENLWEIFASAFSRTWVILSHPCLTKAFFHHCQTLAGI